MRIIDKKGRLFGLVNLLDLLIVALVLFFVFSAVSNWVITKRVLLEQPTRSAEGVELLLKIIYYNQPNEVVRNAELIVSGDRDIFGKAVIDKVVHRQVTGKMMSDMTVMVKARCVLLDGQYYYTNMPVKYNMPFTFSAPLYILKDGIIVSIGPAEGQKR